MTEAKPPDARTWVHESGGLRVGNFALCANFPPRTVLKNPGCLGKWLAPLCMGAWRLHTGNTDHDWNSLEVLEAPGFWPLPRMTVRVPGPAGAAVELSAFSPVAAHDADTCSLPVICLEFRLSGAAEVNIHFDLSVMGGFPLEVRTEDGAHASVSLNADKPSVRMAFISLHPDDAAARKFSDAESLARRVFHDWAFLRESTAALSARLPDTGGLGDILRVYMGAAVYLTRITRRGEVLRGDEWYILDEDIRRIVEIRAYYASPVDRAAPVNALHGFDYAGRGYTLSAPQ